MKELLSKIVLFQQDVFRNITYVKPEFDVFSDLTDSQDTKNAAICVNNVRRRINETHQLSDFYYTVAIGYPFEHDHMLKSRYTDGSYPVWYGSLEFDTTLHDTLYHFKKRIQMIEDLKFNQHIVSNRALYEVYCEGVVADVHENSNKRPELVSDDYRFCQQLGKVARQERLVGLLSSSSRFNGGKNINVFKEKALKNPRLTKTFKYVYDGNEINALIDNKFALTINY